MPVEMGETCYVNNSLVGLHGHIHRDDTIRLTPTYLSGVDVLCRYRFLMRRNAITASSSEHCLPGTLTNTIDSDFRADAPRLSSPEVVLAVAIRLIIMAVVWLFADDVCRRHAP